MALYERQDAPARSVSTASANYAVCGNVVLANVATPRVSVTLAVRGRGVLELDRSGRFRAGCSVRPRRERCRRQADGDPGATGRGLARAQRTADGHPCRRRGVPPTGSARADLESGSAANANALSTARIRGPFDVPAHLAKPRQALAGGIDLRGDGEAAVGSSSPISLGWPGSRWRRRSPRAPGTGRPHPRLAARRRRRTFRRAAAPGRPRRGAGWPKRPAGTLLTRCRPGGWHADAGTTRKRRSVAKLVQYGNGG